MEIARDDTASSQHMSPGSVRESGSVSMDSKAKNMKNKEQTDEDKYDTPSCISASQILWSTGNLSEPIQNSFYYVVPDKKLKELYKDLPTIEDLRALETNGVKVDVIIVDAEKDKKLSTLKQYVVALIKGLNITTTATIKKIARFVSDVHKRPNVELSPKKAAQNAALHLSESGGIRLLGKIKHGSCRPRAILFKVLADAVGLECMLVAGLPTEGNLECAGSHKHMSVLVVQNSMELLVDLMQSPGQLIPHSPKAIFMSHISSAWESDCAEYDSCDSSMQLNSPLYGVSQRVKAESAEKVGGLLQGRREASSDAGDLTLRDMVWRSNSVHRRIRSEDTSTSNKQRLRRSMSMSPKIGDEIVRAVRAMNQSLKPDHISQEHGASGSESFKDVTGSNLDKASGEKSSLYATQRPHSSEKAVSLLSSPKRTAEELLSTWNRVLGFQDEPLLPFEEWNIDFSELTVGNCVGVGSFGEVFSGVWNGTDVAIKVFLEQDLTAENLEDFHNEIAILSRLRHPNVILFLGACVKPSQLSMITEYMEMGSLYYLFHISGQKHRFTWRRRNKMLRDICKGLMYIHRMKIIHRDLKSANCLMSKYRTVKICDFGISKIIKDGPITDSPSTGTPEYMAPEVMRGEHFTEKSDIFSLGVVIWELYTLNKPWDGTPPERVVDNVTNKGLRLELPAGPVGGLIADCWGEPQARPSCEEIMTRLLLLRDQ